MYSVPQTPCHQRGSEWLRAQAASASDKPPKTTNFVKSIQRQCACCGYNSRGFCSPLDAPVANAACVCCSSRAHPPPFPCTLQPSPSPPLYSPPRPSSPTSPSFTHIASPSLLRQCTRCTKQLPLPPVASRRARSRPSKRPSLALRHTTLTIETSTLSCTRRQRSRSSQSAAPLPPAQRPSRAAARTTTPSSRTPPRRPPCHAGPTPARRSSGTPHRKHTFVQ